MEYLVSTQKRDASVMAVYVKSEVLAKVSFTMSEKDPALCVTKAVADCYSLHINLRLDFINGKPKKSVEHIESVIMPATLKVLIESKLEMNKSDLKKDLLQFVANLEKMAIIHDEDCHVVEYKKTDDSGMKSAGKSSDAGSRSSGHNSGGKAYKGASNKASDRDRTKSGHGRSSDSIGTEKQWAREPPPFLKRRSVPARSAIFPTVLTPVRKKLLSFCLSTRRRRTSKLWATTERRLTTKVARPRISRRRISE
jgi:hypothetical protein